MTHLYTSVEINKIINGLDNPIVVIGNGLNIEAGVFKGGWGGILQRIAERLDSEKTVDSSEEETISSFASRMLENKDTHSVSLTELYDWILIKYDRYRISTEQFLDTAKKSYSSKVKVNKILQEIVEIEQRNLANRVGMSKVAKWCMAKNADILSTNYDKCFLTLSDAISNGKIERRKDRDGKAIDTKAFPVASSYRIQDKSKKCSFNLWCINGFVDKPGSPRLSLRDYVNYANFIRREQLVFDESKDTWVRRFIDRPLVFAGISLEPQEVILRTLLIERMRYHITNKKAFPPFSYFIQYNRRNRSEMNDVKREFLNDFGVEVLDLQKGEKLSDCFAVSN